MVRGGVRRPGDYSFTRYNKLYELGVNRTRTQRVLVFVYGFYGKNGYVGGLFLGGRGYLSRYSGVNIVTRVTTYNTGIGSYLYL